MKKCSQCGKRKSRAMFRPRKELRDGLRSECKVCDDARKTRWKQRHPARHREIQKTAALKALYGLTLAQWQLFFDEQRGRCKLCGRSGFRLSVDHCHHTGKVRGLLCQKCNAALGLLDDSPQRLRAAAAYLEACATPEVVAVSSTG